MTTPPSRRDLVYPGLLQLLHLGLEALHLLPAVQGASVVLPQTPNHLAARPVHFLGQLADVLPLLELASQLVDLSAEGEARHGALVRVVDVVVVDVGGHLFVGQAESLGLLLLQLLELFGYAGLDVLLDQLGAGGIGLGTEEGRRSCLVWAIKLSPFFFLHVFISCFAFLVCACWLEPRGQLISIVNAQSARANATSRGRDVLERRGKKRVGRTSGLDRNESTTSRETLGGPELF